MGGAGLLTDKATRGFPLGGRGHLLPDSQMQFPIGCSTESRYVYINKCRANETISCESAVTAEILG